MIRGHEDPMCYLVFLYRFPALTIMSLLDRAPHFWNGRPVFLGLAKRKDNTNTWVHHNTIK